MHLWCTPAYSSEVHARIPAALCVIHNLIQKLDSSEGNLPAETVSFGHGGSDEQIGDINDRSDSRRDKIAEDMWTSYWFYIQQQTRAQTDEIQQTDDKIILIAESSAQLGVEKMSIIRELFMCSGGSGVGEDIVNNFPLSSVLNISCWMAVMMQE